jgi:hypothetical protein
MRRLVHLLCSLSALLSIRIDAEPVRFVPFQFEDSRIYVPVRAPPGPPSWFILDTGVTDTILDRDFARSLHLKTYGQTLATGAGAGASPENHVGAVQLKVGSVPMDLPSASVLDLKALLQPTSGRAPAGIIGSQFFAEHVVEIDFRARRLAIWPIGTDLAARFKRIVPLTFHDMAPLADAQLTLPSGERLSEKVLVDLGAKSTLLIPEPFIASNHLDTEFPRGIILPLGAGVGGNTYYRFAGARQLALSGDETLALSDPVVGLSVRGTLQSRWHEGLLGADFLSRFRIAFDYSRARLLVTRQSTLSEPLDRSGLFIICAANCSNILIRDVSPGSAGDRAGLKPGDQLIRINKMASSKLSLATIRSILKGRVGTVRIVVRRGVATIRRTLQLADLV